MERGLVAAWTRADDDEFIMSHNSSFLFESNAADFSAALRDFL